MKNGRQIITELVARLIETTPSMPPTDANIINLFRSMSSVEIEWLVNEHASRPERGNPNYDN